MSSVLVLQHEVMEPLGTLGESLQAAGVRTQHIRVYDGEPVPANLGQFQGLVVMGGPMGVYEQDKYPYLTEELRLIRHVWEEGIPILGVCLGSQLLASALGATVEVSPHPEIGWHPIMMSEAAVTDPLWTGLSPAWMGFHWHEDIHGLPAGAVRLAHSQGTPTQAFRDGPHAYGFQFHLEVNSVIIGDWLGSPAAEPGDGVQSRAEILAGMQAHLGEMQALASTVFGRWARLVTKTENLTESLVTA
jgi:GMP synthase (glutamine-hydrolysing)